MDNGQWTMPEEVCARFVNHLLSQLVIKLLMIVLFSAAGPSDRSRHWGRACACSASRRAGDSSSGWG